jgi:hypothetical protein
MHRPTFLAIPARGIKHRDDQRLLPAHWQTADHVTFTRSCGPAIQRRRYVGTMTGNDASDFEIVIHGNPPGPGFVSAAQRGLARINAPSNTSVVFTSSFVDEVQQATGDASYSAARGAGVVGGISVPNPAGGTTVFINTEESERFDSPEIERLLAHEGGHALLYSRGEAWREHDKSLMQYKWQWLMMLLGGVAAEEYRIESALRELGYGPSDSSSDIDHMEETLQLLNSAPRPMPSTRCSPRSTRSQRLF